jgi:hypothetical protein
LLLSGEKGEESSTVSGGPLMALKRPTEMDKKLVSDGFGLV